MMMIIVIQRHGRGAEHHRIDKCGQNYLRYIYDLIAIVATSWYHSGMTLAIARYSAFVSHAEDSL